MLGVQWKRQANNGVSNWVSGKIHKICTTVPGLNCKQRTKNIDKHFGVASGAKPWQ